ncbi:MAG: phosphopantetheine-binding protein [Bacillaceae bacterium]|nr:phosphopantetheine-binding protein [Bacillaceae bacterium]
MDKRESVLLDFTNHLRKDFNVTAEIKLDSNIKDDIGLDSLATVEVIFYLENAIGRVITEEEAEVIETIGDAVDFILKNSEVLNA